MSLDEDILAHLDARPTENARLIRLQTPLSPSVLVAERLDVDEAIGPLSDATTAAHPYTSITTGLLPTQTDDAAPDAASRIVLHALSGDAHLDLQALLGEPVTVGMLTGLGVEDLRPWHGHITHAARLGSDGGLARYRFVVEPWLSFLAHRVDSRTFQDRSVQQIAEEIFAGYMGQGALQPAWRWDLADPAVYPRRSLSVQYRESDLHYLHRLLREEGLFYWWEHAADGHTLVIADHNGAMTAGRQEHVRFTQSGPSLNEDSLTQLQTHARVQSGELHLASADYRTLALRPQSQAGQQLPEGLAALSQVDVPGAYAFEDDAQGQRLSLRQMQALDAQRLQFSATGSLRSAAAGHYLHVSEHPVHDGSDPARDRLLILRARHQAHNNLHADILAQLQSLGQTEPGAPADEQPLHQCQLQLQALAVPVRRSLTAAPASAALTTPYARPTPSVDNWADDWADDAEPEEATTSLDVRLHPQPLVSGVQTALVVGLGEPVHTDRDQRVKVQFHWQRGNRSSHRLTHPQGQDDAPASEASGTWVRVATPVAGQNWGSVFTPRLSQEVLVAFVAGDIERAVVIGSVYNGQGLSDAQGNQRGQGPAGSTGNAPSWFAGEQGGHAHDTVLSGLKSQELPSSQGGGGGHNQLVFDDSPGQGRIELSSTQAGSRLQLGHLRQQSDNQRLALRGHGMELASQAWGAVRAGAGLLISAHRHSASTQGGQQLEARSAQARLQAGQELVHTLASSAQDHQAKLQSEPAIQGATEKDSAKQLPTEQGLWALQQSLQASDQRQGGDADIGGGAGRVAAWGRPDLVLAAPSGIVHTTPVSGMHSAGANVTLSAGQDIGQLAQGNWALAAKDGIVLYSYGQAGNTQRAVQHTGIALHAASGSVTSQSLTGATHVAAQQGVQIASTQADVKVSAPQHVLLAAGGAGIRIEGGAITLSAPGNIVFKAGMKVFAGAGSASAALSMKKPGDLKGCAQRQVKGLDAITEF